MINKAIVLDANILIRAVLGKRVRKLIFTNASTVKFFAPDVAYADARSICLPCWKNEELRARLQSKSFGSSLYGKLCIAQGSLNETLRMLASHQN